MAGSPEGGYRTALRHRDFRLLMLRYATSGVGSWAYIVALVAFVYEQTGSPAWVAATSLARLGPQFLFGSIAGVVAERFERTRVMLVSDLGALVAMLALIAVVLTDAPAGLAVALAAVAAVVTVIEEPAVVALVAQVVGEDDLAAANGLYRVIDNLNVITGPAVGAVLLITVDTAGAFAVNALTFAVAAAFVTRLHVRSTPTDVTDGGSAGVVEQLTVGVRAIGQSSSAVVLVIFSVLASFVWGVDTVLFPVLGSALGMGANGFGLLLTGLGIGGVTAGLFVNRVARVPRLGSVIAVAMLAFSIPTVLLVVIDDPVAVFVLQIVRGAGVLIADVLAVTALQRALPSHLISRVFGAFLTLQVGGTVFGALAGPPLLRLLDLQGTLLVVGLGVPAVLAAASPWLVAMDRNAVIRLKTLDPRIQRLEALGIFERASRPVLERLAAAVEDVTAAAGERIIAEGDPADALYVLVEGDVDVTARGELDDERHLRTMHALTYFGEIGLIEGIARTATVTAATPCVLYRIDGEVFLDALTATPATTAFVESARTRLTRTHPTLQGSERRF